MNTIKLTDCPECNEPVETCVRCEELMHTDDPQYWTDDGWLCEYCSNKLKGYCQYGKGRLDVDKTVDSIS